jgi:hypothetical protein
MEGSCATGQTPQWAVVLVEEEEEEAANKSRALRMTAKSLDLEFESLGTLY